MLGEQMRPRNSVYRAKARSRNVGRIKIVAELNGGVAVNECGHIENCPLGDARNITPQKQRLRAGNSRPATGQIITHSRQLGSKLIESTTTTTVRTSFP